MLKTTWFIFMMECRVLLRRSQAWLYPLGFFIVVVSLFPLAFTPDPVFLQKYIPGCMWIAALLASLLSIETLFLSDMEEGYLEQCLLSPYPLTLFLFAKCLAQWLVTELPLILLTPLLGALFHLSWHAIVALCLSLLIGTPMLTLIGSFGAALTLGLRHQGALLGLLLLPLTVPILIFGVNMVQQTQMHLSIAGPLAFLAGLLILAVTVFPIAIAATLRMGMDD